MEVRELVTRLGFAYNGAGVAQYEGAVGRIKTLGAGLGTFLKTALAGVTVYAMGRAIRSTLEFGDELLNVSQITGFAVDNLNNLRTAYKLANVEQSTLTQSLIIFSAKFAKAQQEGKGYEFDALSRIIGFDPRKVKDAEKAFDLVADGLSKVNDKQLKIKLSRDLFGRSGAALIPAFGAEKTEEFLKYAKVIEAFGKGPNKTFAEQSNYINGSLEVFGMSLQRLKITIVSAMYPAMKGMIDSTVDWIVANKDAINSGLLGSLKILGIAFKIVGRFLEYIVLSLKWLWAHPFITGSLVGVLLAIAAPAVIAALSSLPVILMGIFLAFDSLYTYLSGGDSVIGRFVDFFKAKLDELKPKLLKVKDDVVKIFTDMGDQMSRAMHSKIDWILPYIERIANVLSGIFGDKIMTIVAKSAGLNLDDLKNATKFGTTLNPTFQSAPSGAFVKPTENKWYPTFKSDVNIQIQVNDDGTRSIPEAVADQVKKVAQRVMREEYRTAFLNLQGIENRGLA